MVLDTWISDRSRRRRRQGLAAVEAAVSLTAALAVHLRQTESIIDLFAAGPDLFLFQTASGDQLESDAVLEILAAVEATDHDPLEKVSPVIAESLESIASVICVFLDWDKTREEFVQLVQENGCHARVVLIRDHETLLPFPESEDLTRLSPKQVTSGTVGEL